MTAASVAQHDPQVGHAVRRSDLTVAGSAANHHRELERTARRLVQAIAEMWAGARSPGQLHGAASLDVIRLLERRYGRLVAAPGAMPIRPTVRSVHVSEPTPGVAEACAVIAAGQRVRALALRLELDGHRWRCTALRVG